jgi:hypothetical protein
MRISPAIFWTAVAIAPCAWFLNLLLSFAIAPMPCVGRGKGLLFAASAIAFGLAIVGAAIQYTLFSGRGQMTDGAASKRGVAAVGMALSMFLALSIVAQSIPNLILAGCE